MICICDHACINQPLGAKLEFAERSKIANAFTIIPIHFQYLIMLWNGRFNQNTKKISRISLKIVTQCCAYLNNDKMHQVVDTVTYSILFVPPVIAAISDSLSKRDNWSVECAAVDSPH